MLRPTESKDGRFRFTVRTEHRLAGHDLARLLIAHGGSFTPDVFAELRSSGEDMTRGQVEEVVRGAVRDYGVDAYANERGEVDENLRPDEALHLVRWAVAQVTRLYPDLVDDKLIRFVTEWESAAKRYDDAEETTS